MGFVYHYTSPEAAMNFLQQRVLWFTDSAYLNDPEELAYCYELYVGLTGNVQRRIPHSSVLLSCIL